VPTGKASPTYRLSLGKAQGGAPAPAGETLGRYSVPLTAAEGNPQPGMAQVALPYPGPGTGFEVEIISLWSNSSQSSTAGVFLSAAGAQSDQIDYSFSANQDIANEDPPIFVPSGSQLSIIWSNLSSGANVKARVQYRVVAGS
jgi:hypothetical protein